MLQAVGLQLNISQQTSPQAAEIAQKNQGRVQFVERNVHQALNQVTQEVKMQSHNSPQFVAQLGEMQKEIHLKEAARAMARETSLPPIEHSCIH